MCRGLLTSTGEIYNASCRAALTSLVSSLELNPPLRENTLLICMLDLAHLGHSVG